MLTQLIYGFSFDMAETALRCPQCATNGQRNLEEDTVYSVAGGLLLSSWWSSLTAFHEIMSSLFHTFYLT